MGADVTEPMQSERRSGRSMDVDCREASDGVEDDDDDDGCAVDRAQSEHEEYSIP